MDDKKPPLENTLVCQKKYLYKIEVAKSNAPAAAWARLSAQGIFPSAFKLSPTGN